MHRLGLLAFALLTACAGGQSGTDQSDLDRKTSHDVDAGSTSAPEGADPEGGPPGNTDESPDLGVGDAPVGPLPLCSATEVDVTESQYAASWGFSRWPFSACVVAPDYGPLNGGDVELTLSGVVMETAAMVVEEWIPEQGCSREDPNVLLIGEPLEPYGGVEDVRTGSVLRFQTDDARAVELVLSAPEYCFGNDPRLDRASPRGECPLWSYRVVEGTRVTLVLSSSGTSSVPEVTVELQGEDGGRELWMQQAPDATGLSLPGVSDVTLGEAECVTSSECGEAVAQHEIEIVVDGEPTALGSGASLVVDDSYLLNASTTTAESGSCSRATTSSVVLSWSACTDVVQRVDGELQSVGYRSCAGDAYPSQYIVGDRPALCAAETYTDSSAYCETDEDCGGDTCDFYCQRPSACRTDADCSPGDVCLCAGGYGDGGNGALSRNLCLPSECESEADCNGLPCAMGYDGFWGGTLQGVFCHTPEDECTVASDCGDQQYCRYLQRESRWVCRGIVIL